MSELILHPDTKSLFIATASAPSQSMLLTAPTGSGKFSLAVYLAELILNEPVGKFADYPYGRIVQNEKTIGIESIRELEHFLSLKVPLEKPYNRVAIIDHAERMTTEAQNALLKTLEEPPAGTIIIMTADYAGALLPTIRSRTQQLSVQSPDKISLKKHFTSRGFEDSVIEQAYALSGGAVGVMTSLLDNDEHPLNAAVEQARSILSKPLFERLIVVDNLSKDRELAAQVTEVMQRMAHVSLLVASGSAAEKWQRILSASYACSEALRASAQPKLALTDMVLQF